MIPFLIFIESWFLFMHDTVHPHRTRSIVIFLDEVGINWLEWSDFNPIKHVWNALKKHVKAHQLRPESLK